MLELLDDREKNEFKLKESNHEYLLKLVIERNSARENLLAYQQMNNELLANLRDKSIELANKIEEHRNQLAAANSP